MNISIGDIVRTSKVYGKERIAVITNIFPRADVRLFRYCAIICGMPELPEVHIAQYEILENLTKKTVKNTIK